MKKIMCFLMSVLMIFCCGCTNSEQPDNRPAEDLLEEYLKNIESFETPVREYGKTASYILLEGNLMAGILYPETEIEALNEAVNQWVEKTVSYYLEETDTIKNQSEPAELTVAYDSCVYSSKYVSIKMSGTYIAEYMAHPVDITKTFNADIETGKLLSLNDILIEGKIKTVEKTVIKKAGVKSSDVDKKLLDNWFLTKDGLEITLNRGEYLPMSSGTKTVFFPTDELKGILKGTREETSGTQKETTKAEKTPQTSQSETVPEKEDNNDKTVISPNKPMIALTFDDGPSAHTERLLDIFEKYGGKGTFFVLGNLIKGRESTLKRISNQGHEIGNHSWNHRQFTKLDEKDLTDQIMMTRAKILDVTGKDCLIVRPPYGACNDDVRAIGKELGVSYINWSVDTLDWKSKNAKAVYNETMKNVKDGAIILYHDLHKTTVDAMEKIIPELINQGYQLVTVTQLLTYHGQSLEAGKMYYKQSKSTK